MPVTRRQVSAASTANPPPRATNAAMLHSQLVVSDDDLFEQSAIQVSSASRLTRTVNHKLPVDLKRRLHPALVPSVAKSVRSDGMENGKFADGKGVDGKLVDRNFTGDNETDDRENRNDEGNRVQEDGRGRVGKSLMTIKGATDVAGSKSRVNMRPARIPPLMTAVLAGGPATAQVRKTPLTPAERERARGLVCTDNSTKTDIALLQRGAMAASGEDSIAQPLEFESALVAGAIETVEKSASEVNGANGGRVDEADGVDVVSAEGTVGAYGVDVVGAEDTVDADGVDMVGAEGTVGAYGVDVVGAEGTVNADCAVTHVNEAGNADSSTVAAISDDTDDIVTVPADAVTTVIATKADSPVDPVDSKTINDDTDGMAQIIVSQLAPARVSASDPAKTTHSEPAMHRPSRSRDVHPVETVTATVTATDVASVKSGDSQSHTLEPSDNSQGVICDSSDRAPRAHRVAGAPSVVSVPLPPTLEDLESLDPELYVKIKSGGIKDDPSVAFVSEADRGDIESFLDAFVSPDLAKTLIPVAIIGEGTFSTVYKVIDRNFYECDNASWLEHSRQNPLDWLRLWRWVHATERDRPETLVLLRDGRRMETGGRRTGEEGRLRGLLRQYVMEWALRSLDSLIPRQASEAVLASVTPRALQAAMLRFRPHFIALKRINATSSPQRILDEMSFLRHLGGRDNVVPLINGLRCEDQVVVTFPYFYNEDFRDFLSNNAAMSIGTIACYMKALLIALAHLHAHGVIHRDVKPSNFLYATGCGDRALLVDFGLAQKETRRKSTTRGQMQNGASGAHVSSHLAHPSHQLVSQRNPDRERKKLNAVDAILNAVGGGMAVSENPSADRGERMQQLLAHLGPGYFQNDPRVGMKASRAGTRGFRAPEVLFKYAHQTTALDVWSAGVILLTLLTRRYPFFQSSDDLDAILEIACIFGNEEMAAASRLYGRKWRCSIPSVPERHVTWPVLCARLNPSMASEIPEECYALLAECLNLNADRRITARAALRHPFITKYAR